MREDRTMTDSPAAHSSTTRIVVLVERYLAFLTVERNLSPLTIRNYAADLRPLFAYLERARRRPARRQSDRLPRLPASMIDAGIAQGSIVRRTSTARSFYRWLRLEGVVRDDPLANVRGPKQARRLPHVLDIADITALIAAADGDAPAGLRDRALLELMYASGLRVSEAHSVDVGSVDLEQRTVVVRGKGNKERMVIMGEPARRALERYIRSGRPKLVKAGRARGEESAARTVPSALFLNRSGTRLSQRRIQLIVRHYALAAGIDAHVHPHLLRHTFATHLLDGGAELRVVQELLGHSNPNTTQIYLHVTEERQRKVVEQSLDGIAATEQARRALRQQRR